MPYEMLTYGYPSEASGTGASHGMRGNIGYAIAYIAGDKKFPSERVAMIQRTLSVTFPGSSGSGVFYNGYIIGLVYAGFDDLAVVQFVIPMPVISEVLKEDNMEWILAKQ